MSTASLLGRSGEEAAVRYLLDKGYKVIERNFRTRNGEIDVVALNFSEKEPVLVFVEIKTRSSDLFGSPFESITPWKLKALERTAQFYKITHKGTPDALRIDGVAVYKNENGTIGKIELCKKYFGMKRITGVHCLTGV